jgi:hypothetical protein
MVRTQGTLLAVDAAKMTFSISGDRTSVPREFRATEGTIVYAGGERIAFAQLRDFVGKPVTVWSIQLGARQLAGRVTVLMAAVRAGVGGTSSGGAQNVILPSFGVPPSGAPARNPNNSGGTGNSGTGATGGASVTSGANAGGGATAGGGASVSGGASIGGGASPGGGASGSGGASVGGGGGASVSGGASVNGGASAGGGVSVSGGANVSGGAGGGLSPGNGGSNTGTGGSVSGGASSSGLGGLGGHAGSLLP